MLVQKLVQSRHPYITLRGNVFCFRFALPRHVRRLCPELPRELKRTLRTDSFPEALYLVNRKAELIRRIKQSRDKASLERLCGRLADFDGFHEEAAAETLPASQRAVSEVHSGGQQADSHPEPQKTVAPMLSKAWEDFVGWKNWSEKIGSYNQSLMENLLFFLGDMPVDQISKKDMKKTLDEIRRLPQRNRKPYRGKSLCELTKLSIPQEHLVSSKTVKEHLKLCQGLFNSYLVKELEVLKTSPTDGLTIDHDDRRYACLGDSQVREILERSASKPEWVRWFMCLAAYTGARRSELARLSSQDFKQCPDTGRYYFVIKQGKTKAARRLVPVNLVLLNSGLLEWVNKADGPLFPTAAANPNRVTEHFASLAKTKINDLGERVVFHSLRHTFITKVRGAGVSIVLIQQVVGHEKIGAGITDRYTHSFALKDLLAVVDVVSYG